MTNAKTKLDDIVAALPQLTAKELDALSDAIVAAKIERSTTGRQALLAEFQEKAAALGLSLEELLQSPKVSKAKNGKVPKKAAAKYRTANGDEWTGRGRAPKWLMALEAEGKRREDFLIDKA